MKTLCIPIATAEKMKESVKNGDINISELYKMSSAERRSSFEQFASKELAQEINAGFEKAMISKQQTALKSWAEKVFTAKAKKGLNYKNVIDKINELGEMGALSERSSDNFLNDLVAERLGVSVSPEEVKIISEKAQKLQEHFSKTTEDGIPEVDYWVARRDMDNYLSSLTPSHGLKVATSISGRGAMLLSLKSPLTNIISNSVNGAVQGFERRLASNQYAGANNEFALSYVKKVNDIYQKSGYDISRMESISDGQKRLGEENVTSQGSTGNKIGDASRAVGRWYEDVVFKQLMGAPDVASSSVAFADSANLSSTKIAKGDKAKALEIFKDSTSLEPQTIEGQIVRAQAIADAQYSTYTNKGGYSDLAMALRTAINNATGNIRLGDQLMPFVKTPANVVQAGVDAAGVGFIRSAIKLPEALKEMKLGNGEPMKEVVRLAVRSGLGMTLAVALAYMFDPDDFTGEYDGLSQKGRDITKAKNAPYNSIRVGDKYISLDYFGPLASAFVGIMYARKYGENLPSSIYQYGRGVASQAVKVPGLREFNDIVDGISKAVQSKDISKAGQMAGDEAIAYVRARAVPAIVNDFAKGTDPVERETGKNAVSRVASSIPGSRQTLPTKVNQLTGENVKGEGLVSTLLFGGRVKTANSNNVVKELTRLYESDNAPTISDISGSKRVKELNKQIGSDKFESALKYYGTEYNTRIKNRMATSDYKQATDEKKKSQIDKIRGDVIDSMLARFGYKKPKN